MIIMQDRQVYNQQIQVTSVGADFQGIQKYIDTLYTNVNGNLSNLYDSFTNVKKYVDINKMKGFQPLAKLDGDDMHYNNTEWTTCRGLKSDDFAPKEFNGCSLMTNHFYHLNVSQLLIEAYSPDGTVRRTLLEKNQCRSLASEFKDPNSTTLRVI